MHNRAKVLFVIHYIVMGGAERLLLDITRGIDKSKFEPLVCFLVPTYKAKVYKGKYSSGELERSTNTAVRYFEKNGVRTSKIRMNRMYDVRAVLKLWWLIKKERVGIVFCTDLQPERTVGLLAGALALTPSIVLSCHYDPYDDNKPKYFTKLDQFLVRFVTRITATSGFHKEQLVKREKLPSPKVDVIYNGVDVHKLIGPNATRSKSELGIRSEKKIVGMVARLVPRKGHRTLLKAAKVILLEKKNVHFLIVGDGTERPNLEALCKDLGISDKVYFLGAREDVAAIGSMFDVAILCSYSELLPVAVLEYMALGKPIVATKVGAMEEIIEDGKEGLLVEPGNAVELADRILFLLNDSAYSQKLAQAAKDRVERNFNIDRMVRDLEELFQSI